MNLWPEMAEGRRGEIWEYKRLYCIPQHSLLLCGSFLSSNFSHRLARIILLTFTLLFAVVFMACSMPVAVRPVESRSSSPSANSININRASAAELRRIPYIGDKIAERIIEHRNRYGPFRKAEHLLLVQGISDARFRQIEHLIRVD